MPPSGDTFRRIFCACVAIATLATACESVHRDVGPAHYPNPETSGDIVQEHLNDIELLRYLRVDVAVAAILTPENSGPVSITDRCTFIQTSRGSIPIAWRRGDRFDPNTNRIHVHERSYTFRPDDLVSVGLVPVEHVVFQDTFNRELFWTCWRDSDVGTDIRPVVAIRPTPLQRFSETRGRVFENDLIDGKHFFKFFEDSHATISRIVRRPPRDQPQRSVRFEDWPAAIAAGYAHRITGDRHILLIAALSTAAIA